MLKKAKEAEIDAEIEKKKKKEKENPNCTDGFSPISNARIRQIQEINRKSNLKT